jgi:hypothetical protein
MVASELIFFVPAFLQSLLYSISLENMSSVFRGEADIQNDKGERRG